MRTSREEIKEARAGDIVALVGLKHTRTGDTLSDPTSTRSFWKRMEFPDPGHRSRVEPKTKADQEKMGVALAEAGRRRPVVPRHVRCTRAARPSSGMGELHLEIIVDRMRVNSRSMQRRRPAGRLPRDDQEASAKSTTPTRIRSPAVRVSTPREVIKLRIEPGEVGSGLHLRRTVVGGSFRRSTSGRRKGHQAKRRRPACSRASRSSTSRRSR